MTIAEILENSGGRRWAGFLILTAIATGLTIAGKLTTQWVDLATWLYIAFAGINVLQKGIEAAKEVKQGQA